MCIPKAGGGGDIINDSPSTTSSDSTDPSLAFSEGERVLVYHDPLIYEAKVIKVEIQNPSDNSKEYLIHYNGWNKKWDEWVAIERLLKFTEENKKLQEELKLEQQHMEKNRKSECLSNMNPETSTDTEMDQEDNRIYVRKGKKRTNDFSLEEELKLEQQGTEKNLKSGCSSNMKPESSTDAKMDQEDTRKYVRKGKKRTSDFSVEKQRRYAAAYENLKPLGFINKKVIWTKIDSLLKVYGGDEGWAFIEEASYKLLIECLLEGQEQLHLNDKEEKDQGILLPKEEEVQETDGQLQRKNSRKKIPRLSSVAGTSIAADIYEPTGSEPKTEEVNERI